MNVVEFLTSRIEEDERAAWARVDKEVEYLRSDGLPETTRDDLLEMVESSAWRRPLAECKAKREVIELASEATGLDMSVDNDRRIGSRDESVEPYCGDSILYALAAVYSDHPDYRQEWKVGVL